MSKKANPAAIGIFVVGAVVLAIVSILLFGSGQFFRKTEQFILYFEDSINGLEVGAPVKFKGVRIGQVTRIYIRFNQNDQSPHVPVIIEIDIDRLKNNLGVDVDLSNSDVFHEQVENLGLRAQLQQSSFVTGLLFVELDYFKDAGKPHFVQINERANQEKKFLEIPTVASGLTEVIKKLSVAVDQISRIDFGSIGQKVQHILDKADKGLGDIQFRKINDKAVNVLSDLDSFLSDPHLKVLAKKLDLTLADGRKLINGLDAEIKPIALKLNKVTDTTNQTLVKYGDLATNLNHFISEDSPFRLQLDSTLQEFSGAARSIRILSDYLERNPSSLISGKKDTSQ